MAGNETRRHIGVVARKLKHRTQRRMDQVLGTIKEGAGDLGAAIDAGKDAYRRSTEKPPIDAAHV
jgi:hypothetical protein